LQRTRGHRPADAGADAEVAQQRVDLHRLDALGYVDVGGEAGPARPAPLGQDDQDGADMLVDPAGDGVGAAALGVGRGDHQQIIDRGLGLLAGNACPDRNAKPLDQRDQGAVADRRVGADAAVAHDDAQPRR